MTHNRGRTKAAAKQCKRQCDGDGREFRAGADGRLAISCRWANIFCGRRGISAFAGRNGSLDTDLKSEIRPAEIRWAECRASLGRSGVGFSSIRHDAERFGWRGKASDLFNHEWTRMDTNPNRCRRFPIIGVNWCSFVVEKLICLPPILKYKDSSLLVGKFAVSVRVHYFQRSDLLGLTRTMVKKISKVLPTATHCDFWSAVASLPPSPRYGATSRRDKRGKRC